MLVEFTRSNISIKEKQMDLNHAVQSINATLSNEQKYINVQDSATCASFWAYIKIGPSKFRAINDV